MIPPLILPDPECSFGYPLAQVFELLKDGSEDRYGAFLTWLQGKRVGNCDPKRLFSPSSCSTAHGPIVYAADLHRWMQEAAA